MRSSSSELLLDQQEELRRRRLLALAQSAAGRRAGAAARPPPRTWRQRVTFYATAALALTTAGGSAALLFLVPLYVDPAISTLIADFSPTPVRCVTTRREDRAGIFNCTWSSCREGCTSDMFFCTHVYVAYDTRPFNESSNATAVNATLDVTDEAVLLDNIKGCGYPPEVDCANFSRAYGEIGTAFPCYYSRDNRTVVLTHYDRDRHVTIILHYFAVPFVVTVASSAVLCAMYCECSCTDGRERERRRRRRAAFEEASDYSISTRVDALTPHSEVLRPL